VASPLKPASDLIEHPGSERYPQAPQATTDRTDGKQAHQESEVLDELIIVTLRWQRFVKKVFLGAKNRPELNEAREKVRREIFALGERANHWADFLAGAYAIFHKYGFKKVDV
jgi:hypothetical protein